MKIQSVPVDKPVAQASDCRIASGVPFPRVAETRDPDRPVIVLDASNSDLEAMRVERIYDRFVCYSLLMIIMLFLIGSISVALAFAYLKLNESDDA